MELHKTATILSLYMAGLLVKRAIERTTPQTTMSYRRLSVLPVVLLLGAMSRRAVISGSINDR